MDALKYKDEPLFNAGLDMLISEIVRMSVVDFINAIIYLDKNRARDPTEIPMLDRFATIKDCREFFLEDYEYMTGSDGEKRMREYEQVAHNRKAYITRNHIRREHAKGRIREK